MYKKWRKKFASMGQTQQRLIIGGAVIGIIVLVGFTAFLYFRNENKPTDNQQVSAPTPFITPTPLPGETIMVTNHGFVPEEITVKKGTYINFANFSEGIINVTSKNKDFVALNLGNLPMNETTNQVQYQNAGTYEYFNALQPTQVGKIIVQ